MVATSNSEFKVGDWVQSKIVSFPLEVISSNGCLEVACPPGRTFPKELGHRIYPRKRHSIYLEPLEIGDPDPIEVEEVELKPYEWHPTLGNIHVVHAYRRSGVNVVPRATAL